MIFHLPVLGSEGGLEAGAADRVEAEIPGWTSVGGLTPHGPWRRSSSRTVCLTESRKAVITSEPAGVLPVVRADEPGDVEPSPPGPSVIVAAGMDVVWGLLMVSLR